MRRKKRAKKMDLASYQNMLATKIFKSSRMKILIAILNHRGYSISSNTIAKLTGIRLTNISRELQVLRQYGLLRKLPTRTKGGVRRRRRWVIHHKYWLKKSIASMFNTQK